MEIYYRKPCESCWQGLRSTQNVPSSLMSKPSFLPLGVSTGAFRRGLQGGSKGIFWLVDAVCNIIGSRIFFSFPLIFEGVEEKVRIFLA